MWLARWPGITPTEKTPEWEEGLYQYFDHRCVKKSTEFRSSSMNLVLQMVFAQLLLLSQFNSNAFLSAGCGAAFQPTFDFIIPSLPRRLTSPPRTSTQFRGGWSLSHCWRPLCPTEISHASASYKYPRAKALVFRLWIDSSSWKFVLIQVPRSLQKGLSVLWLVNFEIFKHHGPPRYHIP